MFRGPFPVVQPALSDEVEVQKAMFATPNVLGWVRVADPASLSVRKTVAVRMGCRTEGSRYGTNAGLGLDDVGLFG